MTDVLFMTNESFTYTYTKQQPRKAKQTQTPTPTIFLHHLRILPSPIPCKTSNHNHHSQTTTHHYRNTITGVPPITITVQEQSTMIRAPSFGSSMPQGPFPTEDQLLAALAAWAGDPRTDGGAFAIAEKGERLSPGNAKRGPCRRVRCDRAGKPRRDYDARKTTTTTTSTSSTTKASSKKCHCPWEIWIEQAQEGWVTSVFSKTARETALERRVTNIHQIHNHALLDTVTKPSVRYSRRKQHSNNNNSTAAATANDTAAANDTTAAANDTSNPNHNGANNQNEASCSSTPKETTVAVNKRSFREILREREIVMRGGERPSIRNGMKELPNEQARKQQNAWEQRAKRLAIYHYYSNTLKSPPPDQWEGKHGTITMIRNALKLPSTARNTIGKVLKHIVQCRQEGVEYTGERIPQTEHNKKVGRPIAIPTDSEDAQIIAQAYQDGISVKKTQLLINQRRKERDRDNDKEVTEGAVYTCLQRLKEESLAAVGKKKRNNFTGVSNNAANVVTVGVNQPSVPPAAAAAAAAAATIIADKNKADSIHAPLSAAEREDATSWRNLMAALKTKGVPYETVEEIAEACAVGKQYVMAGNYTTNIATTIATPTDDLNEVPESRKRYREEADKFEQQQHEAENIGGTGGDGDYHQLTFQL